MIEVIERQEEEMVSFILLDTWSNCKNKISRIIIKRLLHYLRYEERCVNGGASLVF